LSHYEEAHAKLIELRKKRIKAWKEGRIEEVECIRSVMAEIPNLQKKLVDEKEAKLSVNNADDADNLSGQLPTERLYIKRTEGFGLTLAQMDKINKDNPELHVQLQRVQHVGQSPVHGPP